MDNTGRRRLLQVAAGVTCAVAANGFLSGSESRGSTKRSKYHDDYLDDFDQLSEEDTLDEINETLDANSNKNREKPGPYTIMKGPKHYYFEHTYGTVDPKNQFGRLHLPVRRNGPIPIVVFIHGGGWQASLGLDYCDILCQDLASLGVASWNIEYRRVHGGGGWPVTLNDVASAIDFLVSLKNTLSLALDSPVHNLDLKQVYLAGHSSGGHLAAWAAARHQYRHPEPGAAPNPQINIAGVIPLAGVFDLPRALRFGHDRYLRDFFRGIPEDPPIGNHYRTCSPINYLPMTSKVLAFHGDQDAVVNIDQSIAYVSKARNTGTDARLFILPGVGHGQIVQVRSATWKFMIKNIVDFIPGAALQSK